MTLPLNLVGNDLVVDSITATTAVIGGNTISGAELAFVDGVTAGTATASKALVLGASKEIATITSATITTLTAPTIAGATTHSGVVTFGANPTFSAGFTLDVDSGTATLSSNAATVTTYAGQITSEALTTAAGAAQAFVLTLTGLAATDLAFVTPCGGTNTREHIQYKAICTTNTLTVTLNNIGPTNAVNGTVKFNYWVVKA